MGNKRIIHVAELRVGDAFTFDSGPAGVHVVLGIDPPDAAGGIRIESMCGLSKCVTYCRDCDVTGDRVMVTIGYTNRKAKRARGKAARRERLSAEARASAVGADQPPSPHDHPTLAEIKALLRKRAGGN